MTKPGLMFPSQSVHVELSPPQTPHTFSSFSIEVFSVSMLSTLLTSQITSTPFHVSQHDSNILQCTMQRAETVHSNLPHDLLLTNPGLIFPSQSVQVELSPPQTPHKSVLLPLFLTLSQPKTIGSTIANFKC